MKIVLATHNPHKLEEIENFFQEVRGVVFEPAAKNCILKEEGETLRENALQKARAAAQTTLGWALADDTGLFVEALGGRPGIYSSRYAGEKATYEENAAKLLDALKETPEENRTAYFSCIMALVHPDGREVTVEGRLEGCIASASRGQHGFGYDPVFFLPDRGCRLAELSLEEKNKISHRGRALYKMRGVLEELMKMENSKLQAPSSK